MYAEPLAYRTLVSLMCAEGLQFENGMTVWEAECGITGHWTGKWGLWVPTQCSGMLTLHLCITHISSNHGRL